jgi:hypothetical protein
MLHPLRLALLRRHRIASDSAAERVEDEGDDGDSDEDSLQGLLRDEGLEGDHFGAQELCAGGN